MVGTDERTAAGRDTRDGQKNRSPVSYPDGPGRVKRQGSLLEGVEVMLSTLKPAIDHCTTCDWPVTSARCRKCGEPLCRECAGDRHGYCAACGLAKFGGAR